MPEHIFVKNAAIVRILRSQDDRGPVGNKNKNKLRKRMSLIHLNDLDSPRGTNSLKQTRSESKMIIPSSDKNDPLTVAADEGTTRPRVDSMNVQSSSP